MRFLTATLFEFPCEWLYIEGREGEEGLLFGLLDTWEFRAHQRGLLYSTYHSRDCVYMEFAAIVDFYPFSRRPFSMAIVRRLDLSSCESEEIDYIVAGRIENLVYI